MTSYNCHVNNTWSLSGIAPTIEECGSGSSPGRDIVLCSWARHFTLTVPLSTQVYKWVPANCWGKPNKLRGSDLRWTSIPSRESRNTPPPTPPSCYRNQDKLRQLWASLGSKASLHSNIELLMNCIKWLCSKVNANPKTLLVNIYLKYKTISMTDRRKIRRQMEIYLWFRSSDSILSSIGVH